MSAFLHRNPDCVLIHIPKSAGSSIRKGVWGGKYEGPYYGRLPKELRKHFCFAFVRNPFSRLISVWKMFSIGSAATEGYNYSWSPEPNLSLNDVLDITSDDSILFDARRSSFEEILKHHSLPMTHPFNALDDADFIGRFESLHDDWAYICRQIKLTYKELPQMNYSARKAMEKFPSGYSKYFDRDLIDRVRKVYSEDFSRFGYEF